MDIKKTHIYFIPGLAAGKEIFSNISLPTEQYEVHIIKWMIPEKKEKLSAYSQRMASEVTEPNSVLIGVSFGGLVAQEMSLFLDLKKLIIISSVKTRNELPKGMQFMRNSNVYKLIPYGRILSVKDLTKYGYGIKSKTKLSQYQKYLTVRNKQYLDWATRQMLGWEREEEIEGVIHIHGDKDTVFPIKNIKNCIVLHNGTHIMVINKFRWLNKNLPKIIEDTFY
jgi:hypothetical protein